LAENATIWCGVQANRKADLNGVFTQRYNNSCHLPCFADGKDRFEKEAKIQKEQEKRDEEKRNQDTMHLSKSGSEGFNKFKKMN
jgi:hypothetical protein